MTPFNKAWDFIKGVVGYNQPPTCEVRIAPYCTGKAEYIVHGTHGWVHSCAPCADHAPGDAVSEGHREEAVMQ